MLYASRAPKIPLPEQICGLQEKNDRHAIRHMDRRPLLICTSIRTWWPDKRTHRKIENTENETFSTEKLLYRD